MPPLAGKRQAGGAQRRPPVSAARAPRPRTIPSPNGRDLAVIVDPVGHFFRYAPAAWAMGLRPVILAADPDLCRGEARAYADAVGDNGATVEALVEYDRGDERSAAKALEPFAESIRGLVAGDEVAVALTARIGRRLGFPYASAEDARCQQIKSAMKQRLAERGVPTARFAIATSLADALAQWQRLGGDAMVKMVDYAMSLGVYRTRSTKEVEAAWELIGHRRKELGQDFGTGNAVIVEEHIGGREFSVEGYVCGERIEILNFCEKLTHPNFMVVGHYIPAETSAEEERALTGIARQCAAALGIRNCVFHAEVHIQGGQAYVIECAARPPGQFSVAVLERVYGFDLMQLNLALACGEEVRVRRRKPRSWNAIMALYSEETGIVRGVDGIAELKERPECYELHCKVEPGDVVHKLETYRDVLGLGFLESQRPENVREAYDWARERVRFCTL